MDQVRDTATSAADAVGLGPNDSSTADTAQQYVGKGIDTVQNSVFGQKGSGAASSDEGDGSQGSDVHPAVAKEVDDAHPSSVEDMLRDKHKSTPVTEDSQQSAA